MRLSFSASLLSLALASALGCVFAACSLGNVAHDDCASTSECVATFGLGSTCQEGYCADAPTCTVTNVCRAQFGYGAVCESTVCVPVPVDVRCNLSEPPELVDALGAPIAGRILMGAMFKTDTPKERARADAARLAVREINEQGGISGTQMGLIVCNNDGDGSEANDVAETEELTRYLAGGLGVRVILGPSSSTNAAAATNVLLQERLPTVILSASATSSSLTNLLDRFDPETDPFGLFWRTCPSDALQGKTLAQEIGAVALLQKVAVLYQRDTYGQGLEETFRTDYLALSLGYEVTSLPFEIDESDLASAVSEANNAAPQALLIISGDASRTLRVLELSAAQPALSGLPLFLTDGSKDQTVLLSPSSSAGVQAMLKTARGTAPASPTGTAYDTFTTNLKSSFGTDASSFSFLAHAYDAAYCGTYGIIYAAGKDPAYDGFDVAEGLSRISSGETAVKVGPTDFTTAVSELLGKSKEINIVGTSGPLDFDATTGEAPGPIEVWSVKDDLSGFTTE